MKAGLARSSFVLGMVVALCVLWPSRAGAQSVEKAARARALTLQLEFDKAAAVLGEARSSDPAIALEQGRLALYRTDYDRAVEILERPEIERIAEGARLGALARDCQRAMAGAWVVREDVHGVVVRMQDDRDQVLVPYLGEVAKRAREMLARDLGVELPIPIRIEIVRDHFALSAVTGLPEQSAMTTGTVAVANWGRVALISPRATPNGYPWMDTLAHELTHLALGKGTSDRAPLWFQEGVAKRQETRWRKPEGTDNWPSADSLAAVGFDKGLARDLTNLGPSIAMLPSAEQAMVAFAEVESFVNFWLREAGEQVLPKVLVALRDAEKDDMSEAMRVVTGKDLSTWNGLWRKQVLGPASRVLPAEAAIGAAAPPEYVEGARSVRLAGLLAERGHSASVLKVLAPVQAKLPKDQRVRSLLGAAYVGLNREEDAWKQVEEQGPTLSPSAEWFALRGWLLRKRGEQEAARDAENRALSLDPWKPTVACAMKPAPELPAEAIQKSLCEAARRWP